MSRPGADFIGQRLTSRELEILVRIAYGDTDDAIGRHIHKSSATAKTHVGSILAKLDARNRAHAVARGFAAGYLQLRDGEVTSC